MKMTAAATMMVAVLMAGSAALANTAQARVTFEVPAYAGVNVDFDKDCKDKKHNEKKVCKRENKLSVSANSAMTYSVVVNGETLDMTGMEFSETMSTWLDSETTDMTVTLKTK